LSQRLCKPFLVGQPVADSPLLQVLGAQGRPLGARGLFFLGAPVGVSVHIRFRDVFTV